AVHASNMSWKLGGCNRAIRWGPDRGRSGPKSVCGAKGNRTPDLLIANETLYQLSYSPWRISAYARTPQQTKTAADAVRLAVALLASGLAGEHCRPCVPSMKARAMAQEFGTVVIGAGIGGGTVVDSLQAAGYAASIAVVGADPAAPYYRPDLSKKVMIEGLDP